MACNTIGKHSSSGVDFPWGVCGGGVARWFTDGSSVTDNTTVRIPISEHCGLTSHLSWKNVWCIYIT